MNICLKEINKDNWKECIELQVLEDQKDFVSPNWYSIIQAKFEEEFYPMGIYDESTMVGFIMYCIDPDTKRLEMCRLMIDKKHQHKGYGRAAALQLLEIIREKYGQVEFYTSIEPDNIYAQNLYESIGYKKTGEIMWEEEVMMTQL